MKNEWIDTYQIIAIMRKMPMQQLIPAARAAYDGGIRVLEMPFEQDAENPEAIFAAKMKVLKAEFGDSMMLGAGTVLSVKQAEATAAAGGQLIVTPNTNPAVIAAAKNRSMVTAIGALTPTEIELAYESGADYVKLFPAGDMGVSYLKSVRAPLSHVPLMAVGGISPANIAGFKKAGACGFGIGSPLFPADAIAKGDYEKITEIAKALCAAIV